MSYIDDAFGPRGYFARRESSYAPREGQIALTRAVDAAITSGAHLFAEGPCGTGKTRSYALPASYHAALNHGQARRRVIIATASNALSEQLVTKDLPAIAAAVPWSFTYALLKGRSNFLCIERAENTDDGGLSPEDAAVAAEVRAWSKETTTGDLSELSMLPPRRVLERFTVQSEDCLRRACPSFDRCAYEKAKRAAFDAGILVTNYHLLFAAVEAGAHVLPRFDVLLLDEAHEAADIARDFFGYSVTGRAFSRLARMANERGWKEAGEAITAAGQAFLERLKECPGPGRYRGGLELGAATVGETLKALRVLAFDKLRAEGVGLEEERDEVERFSEADLRLFAGLRNAYGNALLVDQRVREWEAAASEEHVYLLEVSDSEHVALRAKCVEPGPILEKRLFGVARSVTACSATLTVNGTFDFARRELGAPAATAELEVPSPFDFRRQALLIVPPHMPDPREPEFPEEVAAALAKVIEACRGRTLGLFTSYKALEHAYQRLEPRFRNRYRVLRQGAMPRGELMRLFKEDIHSVLLATQSFWTGIDVPGEALTAVVIDKLPFPPPNDPVLEALADRIPNSFAAHTVPKVAIQLKQGVGRLVRSVSDTGVVVILDRRLITKGYGARILASLPPMPLRRDLADVAAFLKQKGRAA